MNKAILSFFTLTILLISTSSHATKPSDLVFLPLDNSSQINLSISSDEAENATLIETGGPANIHITQIQPSRKLENSTIHYTAEVKSENLEGQAYLEMWSHFGTAQYFSKGLQSTVQGSSDWAEISTPFMFKKGQNPDKITLNLVIQGSGKVWIRNVQLK
jgi:hypothetical protein